MSASERPPILRDVVPVGGWPAAVMADVLRRWVDDAGDRLDRGRRAVLLGYVEALEDAAQAWRARRDACVAESAKVPDAQVLPRSEQMDTSEVAHALGVTPQRVRQVAERLGGERIGGRWVFDRLDVEAEREQRQERQ